MSNLTASGGAGEKMQGHEIQDVCCSERRAKSGESVGVREAEGREIDRDAVRESKGLVVKMQMVGRTRKGKE